MFEMTKRTQKGLLLISSLVIAAFFILVSASPARAADCEFVFKESQTKGRKKADPWFYDPSNWSCGRVPNKDDKAIIGRGQKVFIAQRFIDEQPAEWCDFLGRCYSPSGVDSIAILPEGYKHEVKELEIKDGASLISSGEAHVIYAAPSFRVIDKLTINNGTLRFRQFDAGKDGSGRPTPTTTQFILDGSIKLSNNAALNVLTTKIETQSANPRLVDIDNDGTGTVDLGEVSLKTPVAIVNAKGVVNAKRWTISGSVWKTAVEFRGGEFRTEDFSMEQGGNCIVRNNTKIVAFNFTNGCQYFGLKDSAIISVGNFTGSFTTEMGANTQLLVNQSFYLNPGATFKADGVVYWDGIQKVTFGSGSEFTALGGRVVYNASDNWQLVTSTWDFGSAQSEKIFNDLTILNANNKSRVVQIIAPPQFGTANLKIKGTFSLSANTTLLLGERVNFKVDGDVRNAGAVQLENGAVFATPQSVRFVDAQGNEANTLAVPQNVYVEVKDQNRNLNGFVVESVKATVLLKKFPQFADDLASDSEEVVLTETSAYSGLFRSSQPLPVVAFEPGAISVPGNGRIEIINPDDAYVTALYQDVTDGSEKIRSSALEWKNPKRAHTDLEAIGLATVPDNAGGLTISFKVINNGPEDSNTGGWGTITLSANVLGSVVDIPASVKNFSARPKAGESEPISVSYSKDDITAWGQQFEGIDNFTWQGVDSLQLVTLTVNSEEDVNSANNLRVGFFKPKLDVDNFKFSRFKSLKKIQGKAKAKKQVQYMQAKFRVRNLSLTDSPPYDMRILARGPLGEWRVVIPGKQPGLSAGTDRYFTAKITTAQYNELKKVGQWDSIGVEIIPAN